jgi:hypothetical protein
MTDEELIEQACNLPAVYVDAFGAYRQVNGVLRCVGYLYQGGAQLNLICSLTGADRAQADTLRVLREEPAQTTYQKWRGTSAAH